jgi:hypothetical protein
MNGPVLSPNGYAACNAVCVGNNTEKCGAPNKLNVYQLKTGTGNAKVVDKILNKPGSTTLETTTSAKASTSVSSLKTSSKLVATPVKSTMVGKRGLYRVWK